jgi:hypothetical protein
VAADQRACLENRHGSDLLDTQLRLMLEQQERNRVP